MGRAAVGDAGGVERVNARRAALADHWAAAIAAVREVYRGRLTYAANFDRYREVGFWDRLDLIGINAYYPLRGLHETRPTDDDLLAELTAGWRAVFDEIQSFQRAEKLRDRPVVFTELGYADRANSTVHPWASAGFSLVVDGPTHLPVFWLDQPPDPTERALAFRALADVTTASSRDPLLPELARLVGP